MVTFKNCLKGASAAVAAALLSAALLVSAAPAEAQALGFMTETSQYAEEIKDYVADVAEKVTERAEKKAGAKRPRPRRRLIARRWSPKR